MPISDIKQLRLLDTTKTVNQSVGLCKIRWRLYAYNFIIENLLWIWFKLTVSKKRLNGSIRL